MEDKKTWLRKRINKFRMQRQQKLCRTDLKKAVEKIYNAGFKKPLDLQNPITINEKLQYLKLNQYYNNPLITICVDKYKVKEYLEKKGLGHIVAKLYAVYDVPEQIEWNKLPKQFVIKCNHGCSYNIICEDKNRLNRNYICKVLKKWLKEDFWTLFAEPQYKFVEKKIIVEEYLGRDIHTYKFYCFNGIPKICYVSSNGEHGEYDRYYDFFDMSWRHLDVVLNGHEHYPGTLEKPAGFDEMRNLAEQFSQNFPFVRVDFYDIEGKIYLSEFTFIPTGGYMHLEPEGTAEEWGSWLNIDDGAVY